jgi:hypothetical protein
MLVINLLLHLVYLKQRLVMVMHHRPVLLTRHINVQNAWNICEIKGHISFRT